MSVCALGIALGASAVPLQAETSWHEEWPSRLNVQRAVQRAGRQRNEAPPLRTSALLTQAAQEQAEEMVASGRRLRSLSSDQVSALLRRVGYTAYDWREAYATSNGDPEGERQAERLAADSRYRDVGVGTAYGDGFTLQVFLFAIAQEDFYAEATSGLADRLRVASGMVERLNTVRRRYGLSPVALSPLLDRSSQEHADDMLARSYFGHTSLEGATPSDRARAEGYPFGAGENLVEGRLTADEALSAWLESPPHRRNLLDPDCREIGLGLAFGARAGADPNGYRVVWVMTFGAGAPAGLRLRRGEPGPLPEVEVGRVVVVGGKR